MASARFSLLPLLLPISSRFSSRFSTIPPPASPPPTLPLPSPTRVWCAAYARRIERRLADLYVDSLEAADYATFLLDLLWKVTGGHPDGAISPTVELLIASDCL